MSRRLRSVLSVLVALGCAAYFAGQIHKSWPKIAALDWHGGLFAALCAAVLVQGSSALLDAWSWGFVLRALQVPAGSREAISGFAISQFAKYLPGNIGQHVGRVAFAQRAGWQTGRVIVSMLIENGFAVGAGGLVAALGLAMSDAAIGSLRVIAAAIVLIGGSIFGVVALKMILARPPAKIAKWLALREPVELSAAVLTLYLGVHLLSCAAGGIAVTAILCGLLGHFPEGAWKIPTAVAASWLAGYLVPGAPAGLGVREATLTALLGPSVGTGPVVTAALVWRFSALLADAGVLAVGLGLRRNTREPA